MIKKTLCFSNPAKLSLRLGQIVIISKDNGEEVTRPIEDIGLIVIESHQVTVTSALMAELLSNNVAVMICDEKHMPSGMLTPLSGNTQMQLNGRHQLMASQPLKKQLWQQTVTAKIINQAYNLQQWCKGTTTCMTHWARQVKSGDADNMEARAAAFYWKNLFADFPDFVRHSEGDPLNAMLDYGYAILRATVARAIVGAGLIPAVGIFHSNKNNPNCLVDDIMEPYRPYVDNLVAAIWQENPNISSLTPDIKRLLLTIPTIDVKIGRIHRPLMIAATITTASLARCYAGEIRKISYPEMK